MSSKLSTRWIPDSEFSWSLMVDGLDASGQGERIPVTPANLHQYNVNNISLHNQLIEVSTLMANIYPQDDTYGKKNQPKDGRNQLPKMTGQHVRGLRTGHIL